MSEENAIKLNINQQVTVRSKKNRDKIFLGTVMSVDNWKKQIGILDEKDNYDTYPFRLIKNTINHE